MSSEFAVPHVILSPAYRQALRVTAQWLELDDAARPARFALPAAWAPLDAVERDRLARWLAWQQVTACRHDDLRLAARIQHLDSLLDGAVSRALRTLPGQRLTHGHRLRLSA